MKIKFSKKFRKQYIKSDEKIRAVFEKRLQIFMRDPIDPQLRNHQLAGNFKDYRSINITGDWRAIYSQSKSEEDVVVVFEMFGTHSQLYR